jgi:hypothetical protein
MSKWSDIRHHVKRVAGKAVVKTGDLSDTASLHVKLARKEAHLSDLYEQFGRVAYQKMKAGSNVDHKMRILLEKIDIVRSEIHSIKRSIEQKKTDWEFEIFNAIETEKAVERAEKTAKQHLDNKK